MQILSQIFRARKAANAHSNDNLDPMVTRVLGLNPCLRHARGQDERLRSALAHALGDLRGLVTTFPPPHSVSVRNWKNDPHIRAFFAHADDVGATLARADELRRFFDRAPAVKEAYAVLGMEVSERRTLRAWHEGAVTRADVPQVSLNFGAPQMHLCAPTVSVLRDEFVARMVDQLAIEALALITEEGEPHGQPRRERALLATRLKILQQQGTGLRSVAGGGTPESAAERTRLETLMDENDRELRGLGLLSEAFDRQLDCFCEVFMRPASRIRIQTRQVRVGCMNVRVPDGVEEDEAHTLELGFALVSDDPPRECAISLVRVARADMPWPQNALEQAERLAC